MSVSPQQINRDLKEKIDIDIQYFPVESVARVRYSMALASRMLAGLKSAKQLPTEKNPIILRNIPNPELVAYLWTALMVFGSRTPGLKFGNESIKIIKVTSFNPENELGFFSVFSGKSLYETVFRHHLTEDMLKITSYSPAFDSLPSHEPLTFEEQVATIKTEQTRKEEARRQADPRVQEETKKREEDRRQEENRKQLENKKTLSNELINIIQNTESSTPLFTIRYFLKMGADINFQDKNGDTPLLHALSAYKENVADYLLKKGADPFIANNEGELPIHLTSAYSSLFLELKDREKNAQLATLSRQEKNGILLLEHIACPEARIQKIDEYLASTSIDFKNQNGYTPLMIALDVQNDRIAEYLLKTGADPLQKNNKGRTARDLVSRHSAIYPIIKGYELLFFTQRGHLSAIQSLLNADINLIDFQGNKGYTALLIAVELNLFPIVEYLLLQGANTYLSCDDGNGVFDLTKDSQILALFSQNEEPETIFDDSSQPFDTSSSPNEIKPASKSQFFQTP